MFSKCLEDVAAWMTNHCPRLNGNKTEVMIVGKPSTIWSSSWCPGTLGQVPTPKMEVKNLRVWFDSDLTFDSQICKVAGKCYGTMKILRKILDLLPPNVRKTIVHAVVTSQMDYGNVLYLGASKKGLSKLQTVQNAVARLVLSLPRKACANKALAKLHWLPVEKRIIFKAMCYCHLIISRKGPRYLQPLLTQYIPGRTLRSQGISVST